MSGYQAKAIQAKDVPLRPILELLDEIDHGRLVKPNAFSGGEYRPSWACMRDIVELPEVAPFPYPVVHAKMRALIAKGTVNGCACGCRGDFTITDKGRTRLAALRPSDSQPEPSRPQEDG